MQIIFKDKNERDNNRSTSTVGIIIHTERGLVKVWKKNLLEDLKIKEVEFKSVEESLLELRKEFGGGYEELVKVMKLRRIKQREKMTEEFRINRGIRRKLIEVERSSLSIEQWYDHTINLDQHQRESKKKD